MKVNLHEASKPINFGRGLRGGETMYPKLFITLLKQACYTKEINIAGENHLRLADKIVLTTDELGKPKKRLHKLEDACS